MKCNFDLIKKHIDSKKSYVIIFLFYILMYIVMELKFASYKLFILRTIKIFIIILAIYGMMIFYNSILNKDYEDNVTKKIVIVLFAISVLLKLLRIYMYPYYMYQHDVGGKFGHVNYIKYIVNKNVLPEVNTGQFYHAPLHHIICAIWLKINLILGIDETKAIEGMQYLTAFYSTMTVLVSYKIFKIIGFKDKILILCTALISTAPTLIILSSILNNDILMIMLMFMSILYIIKWYVNPTISNISMLALTLGLAMMAKTNAVLLSITIAIIFIIKLKESKNIFNIELWKQYFAFGFISIPLGMWYPVRNFIKFKQPLGYVLKLSEKNDLFVGNYSIKERFFSFHLFKDIINNPKCDPFKEYNLPAYIIKSSMLNEYLPNYKGDLIKLLLLFNIIIIGISLCAMIYSFIFIKKRMMINIIMGTIWVTQITSFIFFNIKYPFGCTMDFRYIVPTLLTGAIFIAMLIEDIIQNKRHLWNKLNFFLSSSIYIFILLSIIIYTI